MSREDIPSTGWIDISVPLHGAMVHWPSDPPLSIERKRDMDRGDAVNSTLLSLGAHTGTHMDAPRHFLRDGDGIDALPLEIGVGQARVITISDPVCIRPDELAAHPIRPGERILFRTRNSESRWHERAFDPGFVYLSLEAAELLAETRVALIGIDYLSIGGYKGKGHQIHRVLMEAGVWILEGIDLSQVADGDYSLICLPLRIAGNDGAPARAIVRPISHV